MTARCVLPFLLLLATSPSLVLAQSQVVGTVIDERLGVPINGAVVHLIDGEGQTVDSVLTADGGRFTLSPSARGPHQIRVSASGYVTRMSPLASDPEGRLTVGLDVEASSRTGGGATITEGGGARTSIYDSLRNERGGQPVSDASIMLVRAGVQTTSAKQGFFAIERGQFGEDTLVVWHLSFEERRIPVRLDPGQSLQVFIDLSGDPLPLEGLEVNVRGTLRARQMIEHHRRRELRSGFFMSADDLEGRGASRLGELMQGLPSLRVDLGTPSEAPVIEFRGRRCMPRVWVDGRELRPAGAALLRLRDIRGADLEALEVYRGDEAPLEFGGGACVTILAWTRRG